jgi:hypothetical protein
LLEDVLHPVPVDVLLGSIRLVPTTDEKLGRVVPHDDQFDPVSV